MQEKSEIRINACKGADSENYQNLQKIHYKT